MAARADLAASEPEGRGMSGMRRNGLIEATGCGPFLAVSASDRTDDWPFWYVTGEGRGLRNITAEVMDACGLYRRPGQTLASREVALAVADFANRLIEERSDA
jgi:hypothetical protein